MIEPIMYFGIGFLVASLFGLVLVPLVHNRAVRLTIRRLEAATPLSMAEIQADKDQLRAEFAMSTRRLELSVEQLKARTTSQLAELGKKTDAINRLKVELGEKTATIFALEAREKSLREQLRATEEEYKVKSDSLHEAERALADKEAELAKLAADLNERTVLSDSQRVEIVALRTQIEALKDQVNRYERDVRDAEDRLTRERRESESVAKALTEARGKVQDLAGRVTELERQLVAQTTEAELLGRRVQELETRLNEQGRLLVEREYEISRLRSDLDEKRRTEADLRAELSAAEERHNAGVADLKSENKLLQEQLAHAHEERGRLQRDIASMKHETEATWASERVENAMLRERINDIAAEVAKLTLVLEGPGSPIEAILAADKPGSRPEVNGVNGASGEKETGKGSLADRIRALQSRASRLAASS